jgi:AcrR family transcriptional regulator
MLVLRTNCYHSIGFNARLREMTARPAKAPVRTRKRATRGPLPARGGYRKGDETQRRILETALHAFGEAGFAATSTRKIAEAAGVTLPAIQYYFGGKEGLYRACAEQILSEYRRHAASAAEAAALALGGPLDAASARAHLKAVFGALAGLLVTSTEAQAWASYVAREMREPGPAFELLYRQLWEPGIMLTSRLIARVLGQEADSPAARVHALLLISGLTAFQSGRRLSKRAMHWSTVGEKELALVREVLEAQIDALGVNTRRTP